MDAVWDGRSDGSKDEAGQREVVILGTNMGRPIVTNGDFAERHGPVPKLLWADLFNFSSSRKQN